MCCLITMPHLRHYQVMSPLRATISKSICNDVLRCCRIFDTACSCGHTLEIFPINTKKPSQYTNKCLTVLIARQLLVFTAKRRFDVRKKSIHAEVDSLSRNIKHSRTRQASKISLNSWSILPDAVGRQATKSK